MLDHCHGIIFALKTSERVDLMIEPDGCFVGISLMILNEV